MARTTSINAALVARAQTVLSLAAFGSAFAIGCYLHYRKIVKNGVAGWPQEWLPSVSATIGDWYPERNIFQLLIALTAAPRFAILFLTLNLHGSSSLFAFGLLRTLLCGGWVYVTSSDDGLVHDVCMVLYIVMNVPWMAGSVLMSKGRGVRRLRTAIALTFFGMIAPLVYWYLQHKVHRIPGAYSYYAIFEWSLILFDVLFDAIAEKELREQGVQITLGAQGSPTKLMASSSSPNPTAKMYDYHSLRRLAQPAPKAETTAPSVQAPAKSKSAKQSKKEKEQSQKHEEVVQRSDGALKDALETALAPATVSASSVGPVGAEADASRRGPVSFISDVYRAFVFWSLFTALIPTLFYFSIWELGIAGAEAALFALLTPALLSTTPFFLPSTPKSAPSANKTEDETGIHIPTWYAMLRTRRGQVVAYLVQYTALLAFLSNSPSVRLGVVFVAVSAMTAREVVLWAGLVEGEGEEDGHGWSYWSVVSVSAFVVASGLKGVNHGNNPIWPFIDPKNGGWNKTGLVFATLSLLEFATRPSSTSSSEAKASSTPLVKAVTPTPSALSTLITTSLPLGSLLFSTHNLLQDPSTLVAASWTGWGNRAPRGPMPHIFGVVTLVFVASGAALGIALSSKSHPFASSTNFRLRTLGGFVSLRSPAWWIVGAGGAYGMFKQRNWEGYSASLVLAFFLASIAPAVLENAAEVAGGSHFAIDSAKEDDDEGEQAKRARNVAKVYASAMFVYILLNLASIFTVAYAFVPGGWVFRERTDAVLTTQLLLLAPIFSWPGLRSLRKTESPAAVSQGSRTSQTTKSYAFITLTLITVFSLISTIFRLPVTPPKPHKQGKTDKRLFNAGIWTVHFGFDNEGHDSQRGMRELIRDMELDVVGLLETDLQRTAFGHRDLTRVLVEDLGYYVDVGPGPNSHTWGAVLLSKFPIINTTHHLLPSPHGELAPAIEAVLDVHGTEITVIVAHNGQEEDKLDRELQSTELARIMRASPRPVVFLGYVVTRVHALRPNPYEVMTKDGNVHDIDKDDKDRWCEYIFYRGLYRTSYARLSRGIITDTELQVGQFVLPKFNHTVVDESEEARYRRSKKEVLEVEHWFPMEYYGNQNKGGKNGHYYHVFYTPLYYLLPEGAVV